MNSQYNMKNDADMYLSAVEDQQKQLHLLEQLQVHSDPVLSDDLNSLRQSKGFLSSKFGLGPTSNTGFSGTTSSTIARSVSTTSSESSSNNSSPNHTHMNNNSDIQSLMNDIALPSPSVEPSTGSTGGRFNFMLNAAPGLVSGSSASMNMNTSTNTSTFNHLSSVSSSNGAGNASNNNGHSYANRHPNQLQHGLQYGDTGINEPSVKFLATAPSLSELRHSRTRSQGNDSFNNFSSNESCSSSSSNLSNNNNNNSSSNGTSFPSFTTRMKSVEEFKTNDTSSCNNGIMFNSPSFIGGMPFDSWRSSSIQEKQNLAQQHQYQKQRTNATSMFVPPSHYESRSMNHNSNIKPPLDPAIIIGPLLNMGFNMLECEAAANAIRNISLSSNGHSHCHSPTLNDHSLHNKNLEGNLYEGDLEEFKSHHHHNHHSHHNHHQTKHSRSFNNSNQKNEREDVVVANSMKNLSLSRNLNQYHQGNIDEQTTSNGTSNNVWTNTGKMKSIRVPSVDGTIESDDGTIDSEDKSSLAMGMSLSISNHHVGTGVGSSQNRIQKLIRMLDIPPELNAFVFHCNAQTRDECLSRGLFGCPSGGQYGPHSKAKKGDLLFLADFSAWNVTGIFTAKSDAGLNLEKSAWGGRFPWQIRVDEWSELHTVHIDKINEIIGLASGSKLNMLTKDQLMQLVTSKEFGPHVPEHLFKMKTRV